MSDIRPKVPSNGSLLVQPDGSVQLSGRVSGDPNQVVTFNTITRALESTDASRLGIGTGGGGGGGTAVVTISPVPPENPSQGDLWWNSTVGRLFIFYNDGSTAQWVDASPNGGGPGQTTVTIGDTPPGNPNVGDLWWNDQDGRLYIYYIDSNTAQWVDTNPNGGGPGGGGNVTISNTPPPSPSQGDLWWNDQDGRLYIYYDDGNTQQWVDTNPNGGGTGGGTLSLVSIGTEPPANPSQGALWWNSDDGRLFVYYNDGNTAQWVDASPNGGSSGGGVPVTVSPTPPGSPTEGQLWWNTTDGRLFVYYDDGQTAQWVDASPNGGVGPDVTKTTISDTPPANPNEGDLWWNNEDGRFYIYYDDGQTAQWVDTNPNGGVDVSALQQQIDALEARIAALEGN